MHDIRESRSSIRHKFLLLEAKKCYRLADFRTMSALVQYSDIEWWTSDVRFVPKADILRCGKERRYSITSSARASSDCGTVSPSAFAVLRLMTSSYLVG